MKLSYMATVWGERLNILSNKVGLTTKPHKNLHSAWSRTVFTPSFQYFYTDISVISVTFRNSVKSRYGIGQKYSIELFMIFFKS